MLTCGKVGPPHLWLAASGPAHQPAPLGGILAFAVMNGIVRVARLRKQLEIASRHSPVSCRWVGLLLQHCLAGDPSSVPRDLALLLDLLHEVLVETGAGVEVTSARSWLEQLPAKGRAARVARTLLALG